MPNLEAYVANVLDEQDKVLLAEASDCFAAGANRAAYITIWLAAAESLRRKFVEAAIRDGQAGVILGQIQQQEAKHQAVDGMLIEKAKDYGLISDAEATRLRHIYENRCVFGHPYEQRPSGQLVETAASEAVDIVLGRQLALREGYLSQQVERLSTDPTFLSDDEVAVREYAQAVHARGAQDRRIWFLRKLFSALDAVFADPSIDRLQRRGVWFVRAFLEADPAIFDAWDAADDLPDHRRVLAGVLAVDSLFPRLSPHAQDIVVNVLIDEASNDSSFLVLLDELGQASVLGSGHRQALTEAIAGFPRARLFASDLPLRTYWQQLIDVLKSYTWDTQNQAMPPIRNAGPLGLSELSPRDQEDLGRNITQAAEGNAWAAIDFLEDLGSSDLQWPVAFVRGVAIEPFAHEAGHLRLKPRQMVRAVKTLRALADEDRRSVIDEIVDAIRSGQPRDPALYGQDREEAAGRLRQLATEADLADVAAVADAVEDVPALTR